MGGQNFVTQGPIPDLANDGLSRLAWDISGTTTATPGTIIPAVAGKRIFVHAFFATTNAAMQGSFIEASTAGATISLQSGGVFGHIVTIGNLIFPFQQYPWFTCAAGNAFAWGEQAGGTVANFGGTVIYVQG